MIADSPQGKNADEVVVVGAHLDSVRRGPGHQRQRQRHGDDPGDRRGDGRAGLHKKNKLQRQVRFAFWGAEESGLLGSEYYVDNLTADQLAKIYANLNFDMLGSPNYVRFVYDGDGSDSDTCAGPPGSAQIEAIFNDYFASQGLASEPTAFDGRSDYGPFIAVGIPAGGLFSGAEGDQDPGAGSHLRWHGGCSRTTRATTRPATPSTTSAPRRSSSWVTRRLTPR